MVLDSLSSYFHRDEPMAQVDVTLLFLLSWQSIILEVYGLPH